MVFVIMRILPGDPLGRDLRAEGFTKLTESSAPTTCASSV
jgi:hypothetical protein